MGKFLDLMCAGHNATLRKRAAKIDINARIAQQNLINSLTNELTTKELELDNLTDFAPTSKDSLIPNTSGNWNANTWVRKVEEIKIEIHDIKMQLKFAKETFDEYFTDDYEGKDEILSYSKDCDIEDEDVEEEDEDEVVEEVTKKVIKQTAKKSTKK